METLLTFNHDFSEYLRTRPTITSTQQQPVCCNKRGACDFRAQSVTRTRRRTHARERRVVLDEARNAARWILREPRGEPERPRRGTGGAISRRRAIAVPRRGGDWLTRQAWYRWRCPSRARRATGRWLASGMPRRISAPRLVRHREIRVRATPRLFRRSRRVRRVSARARSRSRVVRAGVRAPHLLASRAGDHPPRLRDHHPRGTRDILSRRVRADPRGFHLDAFPPEALAGFPLLRAHPMPDGFAISKPPATFSGPPAPPPLPPRPRARSRPSSPLRSIQRLPPPFDRRGATSPRTP